MMKKTHFIKASIARAFVTLLLLFAPIYASAQIAIIVHPSNTGDLNKKDITRLFLAKVKTFPNGSKAEPIDQLENTQARQDFLAHLMNKSEDQLRSYWARLIFTGRVLPPRTAEDDSTVKRLVAEHPELIGYISADSVDDTVRVVATFP